MFEWNRFPVYVRGLQYVQLPSPIQTPTPCEAYGHAIKSSQTESFRVDHSFSPHRPPV